MPGTGSLCSLSVSLMIRFGSGADILATSSHPSASSSRMYLLVPALSLSKPFGYNDSSIPAIETVFACSRCWLRGTRSWFVFPRRCRVLCNRCYVRLVVGEERETAFVLQSLRMRTPRHPKSPTGRSCRGGRVSRRVSLSFPYEHLRVRYLDKAGRRPRLDIEIRWS